MFEPVAPSTFRKFRGRHRLKDPVRTLPSSRGQTHGGGRRSVHPPPLTVGVFDVVSVRRPVGRRKNRPPSWASLKYGRVLPRPAVVPKSGGGWRCWEMSGVEAFPARAPRRP